jgi:YegS/Rv2252/BmrU family lipid kinase
VDYRKVHNDIMSSMQEGRIAEPQKRTSREAALIVNTKSRAGAESFSQAKEVICKAGFVLAASHEIHHGPELPEAVRQEIAAGRKLLIIGGGDGSISSASGLLAHRDVVLGVLPLGTANSFARGLGIPLDLKGAIGVLADGVVEHVDLGRIGERYFTNGASIGLPALVGMSTPSGLKRRWGRGAYVLTAAAKFLQYKPFGCVIEVDARKQMFDALEVRIANGSFQGGVLVSRAANPKSGMVLIRIVVGRSKWKLAKEWARLALRLPLDRASTRTIICPRFKIMTVPNQPVAIDGEVVAAIPTDVSVDAHALQVVVPRRVGS